MVCGEGTDAGLVAIFAIDDDMVALFPVTAFETDSGVLLKECFGSS